MIRTIGRALGLALVGTVLLSVLFPEAMLQAIGNFLIVRDRLAPADAVIAISGDGTGERARTAARLLLDGYGAWLIVSGSPGKSTLDMMGVALDMGVPRERILVDDTSDSTLKNAEHSARLMQERGLRRAIVVTSLYHARRAAWVFRSVFLPRRLRVRTFATENEYFEMRRWWTRPDDRIFVTREYAKLAAFLVGLR